MDNYDLMEEINFIKRKKKLKLLKMFNGKIKDAIKFNKNLQYLSEKKNSMEDIKRQKFLHIKDVCSKSKAYF